MGNPNDDLSRRKFVTRSLGCLAAASVAPGLSLADSSSTDPDKAATVPVMRKLGRTDIELPLVNAGAGAGMDPGLVIEAVDRGMRLFDTDARYQNGRHEQLLGSIFSKMGVRDKVVIMTKVHTPEQRAGLSPERSKALLYKTLEGCLRRLRTDRVDILLVHDVSSPGPIHDPAIMEAMSRIKAEGKARYIGTATHTNMAVAINATVAAEIYDVVFTAVNFTMADDTALMGAIENAAQKGVGVIAMKTQAGGYAFPNPATHREFSNELINSAALKWACHNENIATSVPGFANYDHLRANWAVALNPEYTEEEKRFLSDNRIKLGMEFCRQCRRCVASCPHKADVPTMMRTHMYVRQYADFGLARQTYDSIASDRGLTACESCGECTAQCAHSVNIRRKIEELKLVYG